jgi:hypothetical protein
MLKRSWRKGNKKENSNNKNTYKNNMPTKVVNNLTTYTINHNNRIRIYSTFTEYMDYTFDSRR